MRDQLGRKTRMKYNIEVGKLQKTGASGNAEHGGQILATIENWM